MDSKEVWIQEVSEVAKPMITVYSAPGCAQCVGVKKSIESLGLAYKEVDVRADADAEQYIRGLGYQSLPVVVSGGLHFAGFRPDKIRQLAA